MSSSQNPFVGLRDATPPAGLRERVLAAAHEARVRALAPGDWIDRLWESRALRLAWALALALALVGHLAVSVASRRAAERYALVPPSQDILLAVDRVPAELEEAP